MHATTPAFAWFAVAAATLGVALAPWLRVRRRPLPLPAVVDPVNCNGCGRCFDDCPYGAIVMAPHVTRRSRQMAVVAAEQCAACGICVGSCPSSTPFRSVTELVTGIDLPQRPLDGLRRRLAEALAAARDVRPIVVIGCDHGARVETLASGEGAQGVIALSLPCSAALPPGFVEFAQREGAARVVIADCGEHACAYRFGAAFTRARLAGQREPRLREVAQPGVQCLDAPAGTEETLPGALARIRADIEEQIHA
jgi:ferredoxin